MRRKGERHHLGQFVVRPSTRSREAGSDRDHRVDRAQIDDGAGRLAAPDVGDHAPRSHLPDEKGALEIDAQHAIEIRFGEIQEFGGVDDAGIVDQDVETAEDAAGFRHHGLGLPGIAHVSGG